MAIEDELVHPSAVRAFLSALGFVSLVFALGGCATVYLPSASPRVTFTSAGVYKQGQRVGSLTYGTPDAVKGNAAAESEAKLGENLSIAGWVFQVGAGGGIVAGAVVASGDNANQQEATGIFLGALGLSLVGDALWLASTTHSVNAINIYNDGLSTAP